MYYIGIDVGGMSIKAGIVDESGSILYKQSCPTGVERGYVAMIRDMANLAFQVTEKSGHTLQEVKSIGVGIPGIMDQRTGMVPFCTNLAWHDVPILQEFKKYTDLPAAASYSTARCSPASTAWPRRSATWSPWRAAIPAPAASAAAGSATPPPPPSSATAACCAPKSPSAA